ncbi:TetR/AcrR family transcriptional regulator [Pseudomonadota bacterium]
MIQNTQTTDRPRGRPLETGHQDLKTQILDTAEEFFSDFGYAATSIRRIADKADVNPALVHYYFGNKKSLLLKVMERALEPLVHAIAAMKNGPDASPEVIARALLSMAAEHPNIPRLMIREVLLPGGEMQQYFTENMAPHLGGALPALLSREKAAGRMREDSDPAISAMVILAVCVFPFIARALAEPVMGIKFDADGIELLNQQVTELLKHGMMK